MIRRIVRPAAELDIREAVDWYEEAEPEAYGRQEALVRTTLADPRGLSDAFAPFVRPTPQSDPWRHDRARTVS
jgi:plasmid stabilization system protein ParE